MRGSKSLLDFFEGLKPGMRADSSQQEALLALENFVLTDTEKGVMVMTGPAGSGKTFMMKALVQWMKRQELPVVLLAPTGRAAKVLARTTRCWANTLHRQLYRPVEEQSGQGMSWRIRFELKAIEKDEPCVFVVDEASMMGNGSGGGESLIGDLLQQLHQSSSWHKIVLVGDPFQLPPVGELDSPAFRSESWIPWGCSFSRVALEGRYRHEKQSPVLDLAGRILDWMKAEAEGTATRPWNEEFGAWVEGYVAEPQEEGPRLFHNISAAVEDYALHYEPGQTVMLSYSNAWAARFNDGLRAKWYPSGAGCPSNGESLLVVRNQYLSGGQLLANGEEVRWIRSQGKAHRHAGMNWMNGHFAWTGLDGEDREFEGKLCLDLLNSKQASLNPAQQQALWQHRVSKGKGAEKDPFMEAVWAKYPYAQTVHKAQGGAWSRVYLLLEKPYAVQDPVAYLRWLYTAVTRCSDRLIWVQPRL